MQKKTLDSDCALSEAEDWCNVSKLIERKPAGKPPNALPLP